MPRLARIVIPGVAHHVTQRGNRRQDIFFGEADYAAYFALLKRACAATSVQCLGWCLMPNHVHLILVPTSAQALQLAVSDLHRRYARQINKAHDWTGYLFQGRFASYPMDDAHLLNASKIIRSPPALLNARKIGAGRAPGHILADKVTGSPTSTLWPTHIPIGAPCCATVGRPVN
jgi:putative transposase